MEAPPVADVDPVLGVERCLDSLAVGGHGILEDAHPLRRRVSAGQSRVVAASPELLADVAQVRERDVLDVDPELQLVVVPEDAHRGAGRVPREVVVADAGPRRRTVVSQVGQQVAVAVVVARRVVGRGVRVEALLGEEKVAREEVLARRGLHLEEHGVAGGDAPGDRRELGEERPVHEREEVARVARAGNPVAARIDPGARELMPVAGLEVQLGDAGLGRAAAVDDRAVLKPVEQVVRHVGPGEEEPGLLAAERAAERSFEARRVVVGPLEFELVQGPPLRVLADIQEVAVELVRAGLDRRVDHATHDPAVLGPEALGFEPGLGEGRGRHDEPRLAAPARVARVHSVDQHLGLGRDAAVHRRQVVGLRDAHDTRQLTERRGVVSGAVGDVLDDFGGSRADDPGVVLADQDRVGGDRDLLRLGRDQGEVDSATLARVQGRGELGSAQPFEFGGDREVAGLEEGESVAAVGIGDRVPGPLRPGEGDGNAGNRVPFVVRDPTVDRAGLRAVGQQRRGAAEEYSEKPGERAVRVSTHCRSSELF